MLPNRIYAPRDGDVLYHYCSPETFLALCIGKRLRFSDLFSMNDFLEVHWGHQAWEKAANAVLNVVGKGLLDDIDAIINESGTRALPLASCFSLNGDVLSQWRAYGADGLGFAIGFDPKLLVQMPVRPLKVEYNPDIQVEEIKRLILALHEVESRETVQRSEDFFSACAVLAFDLTSFKNPAFSEEGEVRLVHLLNFKQSNGALKLVDAGGTSFDTEAKSQEVQFCMKGGTPVAHLDIDFTNGSNVNPIVEVVVGPRNHSRLPGISVFLETSAIPNVKVRKSSASYR